MVCDDCAQLCRLLIMLCVLTGEAVAENSTSEIGVFGQAILVASRLGAYCGAAWRLLEGEGARHADADKASPLSHFCDVLKLLIRQRIIHRVQVCSSVSCIIPNGHSFQAPVVLRACVFLCFPGKHYQGSDHHPCTRW